MTASIVSHSVATVTGLATIQIAKPDGMEEGDLLVLILTIGGVVAEAATITYPSLDWRDHVAASPVTGTGVRTMQAFKYITEFEDPTYTFTYTAARNMVGVLVAIRGAKRDFAFDPTNYPYGYFAPGTPILTSSTPTTTAIAPAALITTAVEDTLGILFYTQYDSASGSPLLDDPSPLLEILQHTLTTQLAVMCMDTFRDAVGVVPTVTVRSSLNKPWTAVSLAVESENPASSSDNYKSKLLRSTFPPPYDNRFSSTLGKVLTVIGTSDNEIGGLYGDDDFLPDEAP
jgi:hypothetical protein